MDGRYANDHIQETTTTFHVSSAPQFREMYVEVKPMAGELVNARVLILRQRVVHWDPVIDHFLYSHEIGLTKRW